MAFFKKINKFIDKGEEAVIYSARYIGKASKKITKRKKITFGEILLGFIALILISSGIFFVWFATVEIPDLASFEQRILGQSTKIFDRTGKILLYDLSQNMRRTIIPFEEISPNIKSATLAIEDNEFYEHRGIKITSIFRAIRANLLSLEYSQGGSTITQQVVKNSLLTREKTITRKIKEIFLAIKLERNLTKDEIFNLYLNETPYGGTLYGVEEASQAYFGKSARELDITESAYLAALTKAPSYYSPYGKNRDALEERKNLVLSKMLEYKRITPEEYRNALLEEVKFNQESTGGIKAPHFVMFIKQYLEENYGEKIVQEGGLKVTTTLDYDMQTKAEEIIYKYATENGKKYNAKNAALVSIDVETGGILTMVGSRDYFDEEIDGNYNIVTAKRQPGSAFKPIVYAEAFNQGYRPETVLFDTKTQFSPKCGPTNFSDDNGCYAPDNYDGKFRGPMTLRNALAQSINIPAVKLLYLVGVENAFNLAKKMGVKTLTDPDRYGLSLVLGGGEVTLLDLTGAYGIFARNGIKKPTTGILKIEDKKGKVLEELQGDIEEEVIPKDTALLISSVLSDNQARTPIFGAQSSLYFPDRDVAAKTGTTNNYRDAWIIGYTPRIVVGAWSGNNDNSPIDRQVAGYIVGPMWHNFMNEILKDMPNDKFEKPAQKDLSSLKPIIRGVWQGTETLSGESAQNGVHTILYTVDKNNPMGPAPQNPAADPQFYQWEYSIRQWASGNGYDATQGVYNQNGLSNYINDVQSPDFSLSITSPYSNQKFRFGDSIFTSIKAVSKDSITKVDYYLNNKFIGTSASIPFGISFSVNGSITDAGVNVIKAVATNTLGGQSVASVPIIIDK